MNCLMINDWRGGPSSCQVLYLVLLESRLLAFVQGQGTCHSYAAANTLRLILHNVQVQNHLICSSHTTWRCYDHNLPNVPQVSIFHVRNSGGCSLSFVKESHGCI